MYKKKGNLKTLGGTHIKPVTNQTKSHKRLKKLLPQAFHILKGTPVPPPEQKILHSLRNHPATPKYFKTIFHN